MTIDFTDYQQVKEAAEKLDRLVKRKRQQLDTIVLPMLSDGSLEDVTDTIDRQTLAIVIDIAKREVDLVKTRFYARRLNQIALTIRQSTKKRNRGKATNGKPHTKTEPKPGKLEQ